MFCFNSSKELSINDVTFFFNNLYPFHLFVTKCHIPPIFIVARHIKLIKLCDISYFFLLAILIHSLFHIGLLMSLKYPDMEKTIIKELEEDVKLQKEKRKSVSV